MSMSIYYKYAPDGSKLVVVFYVDDCVYWYTNEDIGKCFGDNLGKRLHTNFLGYAHRFMSIRIYQMKYHSISVEQNKYSTSIVAKYLDNATVKAITILIRPLRHLILYSQKQIHLLLINKLRS